MKKLLLLLFLSVSLSSFAQKGSVNFEWKFTNVFDGYDHDSKAKVYIDDELLATSSVTKQTKWNSLGISLSPGIHTVRFVVFALYEGEWEEHIKDNNYSIDAIFEVNIEVTKSTNRKFRLNFDIDREKVILVD